MDPKNFRLLIHHHAVAWNDPSGGIWLPSFIGRWVEALSDFFGEVHLLLHESRERHPTLQDVRVLRPNVTLQTLGPPGYMWDRLPRLARIRRACRRALPLVDGLLIRGITPRQYTVWQEMTLPRKAFLLVHDPVAKPWGTVKSLQELWPFVMSHYRLFELRQILPEGLVMVNSPSLLSVVQERFGIKASFVPTNTIRHRDFAPEEVVQFKLRQEGNPWRLLFCGRIMRAKGVVETLEALSLLRKEGYNCILDIVGSAAEGATLEEFENLAKSLGIDAVVRFHGRVPFGEKLFEFYRKSEIFLLPSHSEGFPHTLWEAAANGCLVVTCPVGGIPDLWKHEEHGLLVPPRNSVLLTEAIKRLISDASLREKLIRNAYARACNYTVEACAEKLAATLAQHW